MTEQYDLKDFFAEDDVEGRLDAQAVINGLTSREAACLYLWCSGHSQAEVGVILGITQTMVSRTLSCICKQ